MNKGVPNTSKMVVAWLGSLVILCCVSGCDSRSSINRNCFDNSPVPDLVNAIVESELETIYELTHSKKEAVNYCSPTCGTSVLGLALAEENFDAFSLLIQEGADVNYINPMTGRSVLMDACNFYQKPDPYSVDVRFVELLLQHGADPNQSLEKGFINDHGRMQMASSVLIKASRIDLSLVKLLLDAGADPNHKLQENSKQALSAALQSRNFDIAMYLIDSVGIDVHQPMSIVRREPAKELKEFYLQDLVIGSYTDAMIKEDKAALRQLKKENPEIEKAHEADWKFIQTMQARGVDFKSHKYADSRYGSVQKSH